jgi:Zn-dependent alcohol dehydrogenase
MPFLYYCSDELSVSITLCRILAIRFDLPWIMTDQHPGDRVAIEPGVPCGSCFLCMDGRYNLCEDVQFAGVYPYHGTLQRYKTHPAKWCHKLPSTVSFSEGALLEPLSVVMHGIQSAGLSLGRGAVICGAGPIGLIALKAARASGVHPLVITDLDEGRLEFAKKFVPQSKTYRVDRGLDAEGNARKIRELFHFASVGEYGAPETVLECTGVESSVVTACYTARRGGTVMVIGVGREIMNNLPFMHLSLAEVSSCGIHLSVSILFVAAPSVSVHLFSLSLLPARLSVLIRDTRSISDSSIATATHGRRASNAWKAVSSISSPWCRIRFRWSKRSTPCTLVPTCRTAVSKFKWLTIGTTWFEEVSTQVARR